MEAIIIVPTALFCIFIAPLWLILHYRMKSKQARGISDEESREIDDLLVAIDALADRVETLEKILDAQQPSWRQREPR